VVVLPAVADIGAGSPGGLARPVAGDEHERLIHADDIAAFVTCQQFVHGAQLAESAACKISLTPRAGGYLRIYPRVGGIFYANFDPGLVPTPELPIRSYNARR
jgi:hypothetical protein